MNSLIYIAIALIPVLYIVLTYNRLVTLRNRVKEAWSDIEVQLKRRYDVIPNLVAAVKGYASHESQTLENVIKARNSAMASSRDDVKTAAAQENILSGTLKSLFALSESYPDLKANQNFLHLQQELVDIEDKIKAARRFYNANVRENNNKIAQFPSNFIASMFSFKEYDFFELDSSEKEAVKNPPKVSF